MQEDNIIEQNITEFKNKIISFFGSKEKINENNICIYGKWGTGKTTFIDKFVEDWKKDIEKEMENKKLEQGEIKNYKFLTINVWEYEISNEPFVDLFLDIYNFIFKDEKTNTVPPLKENFKKGIYYLFKIAIFAFAKIDIDKMDFINKDEYEQNKDTLIAERTFKTTVDAMINEINTEAKDKNIIIIFDELDRTNNKNLIKFIDILKNIFFRMTNIFFIVCCNKERINKILDLDFEEQYTNKIFDFEIPIKKLVNFNQELYSDNFWYNLITAVDRDILFSNFRNWKKIMRKLITYTNKQWYFYGIDIYTFFLNYLNFNFLEFDSKEYKNKLLRRINYIKENSEQIFKKITSSSSIEFLHNKEQILLYVLPTIEWEHSNRSIFVKVGEYFSINLFLLLPFIKNIDAFLFEYNTDGYYNYICYIGEDKAQKLIDNIFLDFMIKIKKIDKVTKNTIFDYKINKNNEIDIEKLIFNTLE